MALTQLHIEQAAMEVTAIAPPPDLIDWLTKLKLLHGIPFNYLVPDEQVLPMETLRFFQIDPNWVNSLTDGALSIGRNFNGADNPPPTIYLEAQHQVVLHNTPNGRLNSVRRAQLSMTVAAPTMGGMVQGLSGFILRSSVVSSFQSMDVMGYQQGSSPFDYEQGKIKLEDIVSLNILRLERLSETVLLGIFQGPLYELVLHEPPEAVHFGFDQVTPNLTKTLRIPTTNWDDPDTKYDTNTYQNQPISTPYANQDARVLNMLQLSKQLGAMLASKGPNAAPGYYQASPANNNYKDHLVSSDFALEMVKGVGLVSFINQQSPTT